MIFLAARYLLARRRQTLLTLLGIFFGAAAYVAISGFMLGFREYLVDQLVNNNAQILIQAREDFLTEHSLDQAFYGDAYRHVFWVSPPSGTKGNILVENPQKWYERLRDDPRVLAFTPQLTANVVLSNGPATASTVLIGTDPSAQVKVTTIGDYVTQGEWSGLAAGGNRLVLGDELRKKLGVNLSQNVLVSLPGGTPTPFKVVAIFDTGSVQANSQAYGALSDVQRVNRTPNRVNTIAVRLHDYTQAADIATTWSKISPEKVQSWDQLFANIFSIFRIQDAVRYLSVGAILIVAGFGIYNVLNMTVVQKRQDIAILRSMGYNGRDVIWLFFSQGLLLALSGSALGLVFGYLVSLYVQTIPFAGGPGGGGVGHLLVSFNPAIYVQGALLAIISASVASILPARAAGRLTPIEIIRAGPE
jgi:lipoprotein-releasing system permease protein